MAITGLWDFLKSSSSRLSVRQGLIWNRGWGGIFTTMEQPRHLPGRDHPLTAAGLWTPLVGGWSSPRRKLWISLWQRRTGKLDPKGSECCGRMPSTQDGFLKAAAQAVSAETSHLWSLVRHRGYCLFRYQAEWRRQFSLGISTPSQMGFGFGVQSNRVSACVYMRVGVCVCVWCRWEAGGVQPHTTSFWVYSRSQPIKSGGEEGNLQNLLGLYL